MSTRPSPAEGSLADRYETLVSQLAMIKEAADREQIDRLEAGRVALVEVLRFLQGDPRVVRLGFNRSLVEVMRAVHDLSQGAKPPLFFKRKRDGTKGAPTHLAAAASRAQMVLVLEILLKAGIAKPEAGKWVADELHRRGVTDANGKRVQPKVLLRWHAERGGKSISGFDLVFQKLEATEIRRGWPTEANAARRRAAKLIHGLQLWGF
jgi:hypothetical protein